jgi:hypothetical protein
LFEEAIMGEIAQSQLVTDIARDLIAQTAPQELPLFQATSEAYFKNPDKMKDQAGKEETLSFDVGTVSVILVSPIILIIVDEVVEVIIGKVADSGIIRKILKKLGLIKEKEKKVTLPLSLTHEQMQKIYAIAVETALQYKLPKSQAEQLAESLISRLTLING